MRFGGEIVSVEVFVKIICSHNSAYMGIKKFVPINTRDRVTRKGPSTQNTNQRENFSHTIVKTNCFTNC